MIACLEEPHKKREAFIKGHNRVIITSKCTQFYHYNGPFFIRYEVVCSAGEARGEVQ